MKISEIESKWLTENIGKIDFLNALTPQQVIQLVNQITPRLIMGGHKVIAEGASGQAFFLIFNGMVSVWIDRNGRQSKLATLRNGDYFGEISLLSGKPTSADVIANVPTKVFFLDPTQFIAMVKGNPKLAQQITAVMDQRLSQREQEIQELMKCDYKEISGAIRQLLEN